MLSGPLPVRRVRRAPPADHVGPRRRHGPRRARGPRRVAIVNGGTIPDRGLYGVFLAGEDGAGSLRVGELDEEMVFESRVGRRFSSARRRGASRRSRTIASSSRRRPGEPGKMPFWHGDRPGRPREFGEPSASSPASLAAASRRRRAKRLAGRPRLDGRAAGNLVAYLGEQAEATGEVPSDRTIVVERFADELGDWRVCVLSPFGARVHAPWATAVAGAAEANDWRRSRGDLVGRRHRVPPARADEPPDVVASSCRPPMRSRTRSSRSLGQTSLFAARFRENAARALLLPRRYPGRRTRSGRSASGRPICWRSRRSTGRSRSCSRRTANACATCSTFRAWSSSCAASSPRSMRVVTVDSRTPSPFAASLLFSFVANFIYDGDAPLAERRAQALRSTRRSCGAPRRSRAARAARRRGDRRRSSARCSGWTGEPGPARRRRCTTSCSRSAI